ncbi:MAG: AAA family ATPase, partial [Kineosporiaceae bacterium]
MSVPSATMNDVARANVSVDLVGREQELTELISALGLSASPDEAPGDAAGWALAVLLGGDAGIGKTRLLEALGERARSEGWRVLAGHCVDLGDNALPYLPITEIVARITAQLPELAAEVGRRHPALLRLEPGQRVIGAADGDSLGRGALFVAVREVLEQAAALGPLLVVLEDAHWADSSTRDLLSYLLTRPVMGRVGLVVSYRTDDLHRRHPLRPLTAQWARLRGVHRLQLGPLDPGNVLRLIAALHPADLPVGAAEEIVKRAEGNAFFVEELVSALTEPNAALPADLADLLLVRLDRLDDDADAVVRLVSVAGRRVSSDLLATVSGLPSERLEPALRQAVEMNVLRPDGQRVAFRHALLAEAVYDDLLPGERVRLHAAYVAALSERHGSGTAAELARHARRALDLVTATTAGLAAAREAMSVGGPADAIRHYEHVLELLDHPDAAVPDGLDVAVVTTEACEALIAGGHVDRAAALAGEYLERLPPNADPRNRARLLSTRASALSTIETQEDVAAVSAEAVRLLEGEESPLRARVLATHARLLQRGRPEEARVAGLAALELAERLDLPGVASDVFTTLSRLGNHGPVDDTRAALADAIGRAARVGNLVAELRGRFWLGLSHVNEAEWQAAETHLRLAVERVATAGTPWAPYHLEARWYLGFALMATGEWDEALVVLADPDETRPPVPTALLDMLRAQIDVARGVDVAGRVAATRDLWVVDGMVAVHAAGLEIEGAGSNGSPVEALAAYDGAVALLQRMWQPGFEATVRLAATTLGVLADAADDRSVPDRAALLAPGDRLMADVHDAVAPLDRAGVETQAWAAQATAEHARLRRSLADDPPTADDVVAAWREAVAAFERYGDVYRVASARAGLAAALAAAGDR